MNVDSGMTERRNFDVTDLAFSLEAGTTTPSGLLELLLSRIDELDGKLGAFHTLHRQSALDAARAATLARQSGHAAGPLHGIPVAFKDIIDIAGYPTRLGSAGLRDAAKARRSASVVNATIAAGMVTMGKTNTVEYALGGWGLDPDDGAPWNPRDMEVHRIPGGSSSGSAVAVSAGLVPVAIGSDSGGSIRMPASFCGIVGLKATREAVPRDGVLELSPTLDTVGPLVRSVRDAELMTAVLCGADRVRLDTLLRHNVAAGSERLDGMRLAVIADHERIGVAEAVQDSFDQSLETFRKLGAIVQTVEALPSFAELAELTSTIMLAEAYALHDAAVDDPDSGLGSVVRRRLAQGAGTSARAYLKALSHRAKISADYRAILSPYAAFLTPTTETVAIPVSAVDQNKAPARFTRLANLVDCFALSVPNGTDKASLPTGLHIMAVDGSAEQLFRIGKAFQAATNWHRVGAFF